MEAMKAIKYGLILRMINRYLNVDGISISETKERIKEVQLDQPFREVVDRTIEEGEKKVINKIL